MIKEDCYQFMYKVIIADDEIDVRERLVNMVQNISDDFEIVGIFENGYDALENVTKVKPDLIITDIEMPFISGLELIKQAKISLPLVKSIIITGYDKFDYAKEAIKLGVLGYISKPISQEELSEVLESAKAKLSAELSYEASPANLYKDDKDYLNVIRSGDLAKLITLKEIPEFLQKKLISEGVDINAEQALISIFDFDSDFSSVGYEKMSLVNSCLRRFIDQTFSKEYNVAVFEIAENTCVYLYGNKLCDIEELEDKFSMIIALINRTCNVSISAGVSNISCDVNDRNFRKLFRHAKRALEYRFLFNGNDVIFFDNISNQEVKIAKVDDNEYTNLTFDLTYGNVKEVKDRINKIIDNIYEDKSFVETMTFIITNITAALLNACRNFTELYDKFMTQETIYGTITKIKEKENILKFFYDLIDQINEINSKNREQSVDVAMDQVLNYIQVHYCDDSICMEEVSDKLGFSISYISQLLKRKNLTFTKYLTSLRMEKAKHLLSDKNKKIINVAIEVGYTDPYYFSHCFKKYYGVSPLGYKNNEQK
jgi:two-component system response regulator YesN